MSILAQLSQLKFFDFGVKSFNTLKDLMQSGREMEERVEEIIQNEVIKHFNVNDPEDIAISLLKGFYNLIKDT